MVGFPEITVCVVCTVTTMKSPEVWNYVLRIYVTRSRYSSWKFYLLRLFNALPLGRAYYTCCLWCRSEFNLAMQRNPKSTYTYKLRRRNVPTIYMTKILNLSYYQWYHETDKALSAVYCTQYTRMFRVCIDIAICSWCMCWNQRVKRRLSAYIS